MIYEYFTTENTEGTEKSISILCVLCILGSVFGASLRHSCDLCG